MYTYIYMQAGSALEQWASGGGKGSMTLGETLNMLKETSAKHAAAQDIHTYIYMYMHTQTHIKTFIHTHVCVCI